MDFDETFLKNNVDQLTLPQIEALLLSRKLHQEFGTDLIALLENDEKTETLFCEKIIELIQDETLDFQVKLNWLTVIQKNSFKCNEEIKHQILKFLAKLLIDERQKELLSIATLLGYFVDGELFYSVAEIGRWICHPLIISRQWIYLVFDIFNFQPSLPFVIDMAQKNELVSLELASLFCEWEKILKNLPLSEVPVIYESENQNNRKQIPDFLLDPSKEVYQKIVRYYLQKIKMSSFETNTEKRILFFLALFGHYAEREVVSTRESASAPSIK